MIEGGADEIGLWEKSRVIGKGGSSTVYKGKITSSGLVVAIKQIEVTDSKSETIGGIQREIETMKRLQHNNILQYFGYQSQGQKVYIFLEYSSRGSLRQYYTKKGKFSALQTAFCANQIVLGLEYLHSQGIAHRDVKCANCLLFKGNVIKLADFGASKQIDSCSLVSGLKGTPHWMAPEVIRGVPMTSGWMSADVWSLGCTVVEMLTGRIPYDNYENPMTAMYHIANGQRPSLEGSSTDETNQAHAAIDGMRGKILSFVDNCCTIDASKRPTLTELRSHEFIVASNLVGQGSPLTMVSSDSEFKSPEKERKYAAPQMQDDLETSDEKLINAFVPDHASEVETICVNRVANNYSTQCIAPAPLSANVFEAKESQVNAEGGNSSVTDTFTVDALALEFGQLGVVNTNVENQLDRLAVDATSVTSELVDLTRPMIANVEVAPSTSSHRSDIQKPGLLKPLSVQSSLNANNKLADGRTMGILDTAVRAAKSTKKQSGRGKHANHPRSLSAGYCAVKLPPLLVDDKFEDAQKLKTSSSQASLKLIADAYPVHLRNNTLQRSIQSAPAVSRSINLPPMGTVGTKSGALTPLPKAAAKFEG